MLGITHFAAGAVIGTAWPERRATSALAAIAAHGALDCIAHDDESVGIAGQAVLAVLGVATVALACGTTSTPMIAGLAGASPDAEVVLWIARGRPGGMAFPSHWQRRGRRGYHPWQVPGIRVPLAVELGAGIAVLALVCRRRAALRSTIADRSNR